MEVGQRPDAESEPADLRTGVQQACFDIKVQTHPARNLRPPASVVPDMKSQAVRQTGGHHRSWELGTQEHIVGTQEHVVAMRERIMGT